MLKKNIILGKISFLIFFCLILPQKTFSNDTKSKLEGNFVDLKILDKVSSKDETLKLKIGVEKKYKNLLIKVLKCKNSEFDDNPEVTAYLQIKDLSNNSNDQVFIFNGWTFLSSPSINPIDHPVYDLWLVRCYI